MPSPPQLREHDWRPVLPRYQGLERRVIVAAVELAEPAPPWSLTQAQFDAVRLRAALGPCPRARQLQRRERIPWRHLVCDALGVEVPIPEQRPELERVRRLPWTRAEALVAVDEFLDWAGRRPPTVRLYRAWCTQEPGRPWPRSLARHGGLAALIAAVPEEAHAAHRAARAAETAR